jgi:hypothetical protein
MRNSKQWASLAVAVIAVVLCGWTASNWKNLRPYDWQQVQSPDGQFRISFPGSPSASQTSETAIEGGSKFVSNRLEVSPARGVVYLLSWWENPAQSGKSTDELFADFSNCAIKVFHSKTMSEKQVLVQGYPAKDTVVLAANGLMVATRVIRVGPRLYSLGVADSPWHLARGDVKRFFGSLSLH